MNLKQLFYLPWWFFQARFFGRKRPLQTVLFISDRCNLKCKHCSVYQQTNPHNMTFDQVREHLVYSYQLGSRYVDFEGGEVMLWRDGTRTINDLIDEAKRIGFFSCTITTNAQLPFQNNRADSIWVSLDGIGSYHEAVRGKGTFARLEKNIASCGHKHLSVNMVVNTLNYQSVDETIEYAKNNPAIEMISINFHTPFPDTEYLMIDKQLRNEIIDKVIAYKRRGYPIMNSISGLKKMKDMRFKKRCWVTNFIYPDGSRGNCIGENTPICDDCGFCMAGEMASVFAFAPDTIWAGLKLRG
ncbi:MAG: radical SAM protein [Bacteroidota bacterium]|jgi:MoaA/NifB/PqqE/SkfB family radical SAM enzyme|nr:radical SAM protein [Bacteroidota bacterium]OQC33798.1 MAG: pyrroloquinoline quinone biosynthesis protein PqqE [Bacteroidetes bacterium ADurb.Bin057]HHT60539.1 radical SAM protein [Bacteroidales bacterium]HOA46402.1 radical SAM protein [Paludibacteraceae bacterium]HOH71937.1 radical SAM protein [Paludibacteraceae bacterium]